MSTSEEDLMINPLFVALTRPPMLLGVTMDYLGLNVMVALCGFIAFSSPLFLIMVLPLHMLGVMVCAIDHNIFRLLYTRLHCQTVPNKSRWGCQSYEPY